MSNPASEAPTPRMPTSRMNGDRQPPAWVVYLLGGAGLIGVGGGAGSFATGSSVQQAVQGSEARIVGRIDLLGAKVDQLAAEQDRTQVKHEALSERVRKLELDAARTQPPR